jgi:hypothetical protein
VRRWLITTAKDSDVQELRRAIAAQGGTVGDDPPTPLGSGEQVVEAEGPEDLPSRLRGHSAVLKVSPDSPKHPYG